MRHSRLNYGRVPGWATVFNGNLKVAALGGGFKKINTYKKVANVYYWWKHSQNLVARVSKLRYFPNSKI